MEVVSSASQQASLSMVGKVEADPPTPDPDAIKMFVGQVPRSMEEVNIVNTATIQSFWKFKILLYLSPKRGRNKSHENEPNFFIQHIKKTVLHFFATQPSSGKFWEQCGGCTLSSQVSCWHASKVLLFRMNSKNSSASSAPYTNSIFSGISPPGSAGKKYNHLFVYFGNILFSGDAALSLTSAAEMLWRPRTDFTMSKPFLGWVTRAQF